MSVLHGDQLNSLGLNLPAITQALNELNRRGLNIQTNLFTVEGAETEILHLIRRKQNAKDITIGQYYPGESLIHRLDPRIKIITTLIYMISLFVVNSFPGYILVITVGLLAILNSKIPLGYFIRGLKPIFILIGITFFLNILLTPGIPLVKIGPIKITEEGLFLGIFMSIRLAMLVLVASLLTLTTTPVNFTEAIENLCLLSRGGTSP